MKMQSFWKTACLVSMIATLVLLLALPWPVWATDSAAGSGTELTLRNEEQSNARVALAYKQGGHYLVEGWFRLAPGQIEVIALHGVEDEDVFIHVEFVDSGIKQFIEGILEVELLVQDTHFRYALKSMGEAWPPASPVIRGVSFQNIPKFYRTEKGKLWFNLNSGAG